MLGTAAARALAVVLSVLMIAIITAGAIVTLTRDGTAPATEAAAGPGDGRGEPSLTRGEIEASLPGLEEIVESAMDETGVPGIAVGVVFDDEVVFTEGYGVREAGRPVPVEPGTVFQIASLSKPVSSTIMAGLVGQGAFGWDDPVVGDNPDFALSDPDSNEALTFADLFSHRSGIPGAGGDVLEAVGYGRDEILRRLRFLPVEPIGATYAYSNFGMTAGGESAAVAVGTPWEELAEQILFEPAGMDSTSMRHQDYLAAENRAALHVQDPSGEWAADFERQPDPQAPAGGVSSNVIDLTQWLRLQLAAGSLGGTQIIDAGALAETHTAQIERGPGSAYGLGWNIDADEEGTERWNHSGAFSAGAATAARLVPSERLGIVVLTNGAPIGVPEAITEAYLELVKTGSWDEGLFDTWRERFSGIYGEPEDLGTPSTPPSPARGDAAYAGAYANDYVGQTRIVARGGGLALEVGPDGRSYPLTHLDGDTFTYVPSPELPDFLSSVVFEIGDDGVAERVTINEFDAEGQGTLERT